MDSHAHQLATYCTETLQFEDLPATTVSRAKEVLFDSIGIAIRAAEYESSHAIGSAIASIRGGKQSTGQCTVWGTGQQTTADDAAFLNAVFVHTPEMDDTHSEGIIHPAASVVPATIAAAEQSNAHGRSVILGIIAGYEVAIRTSLALPPINHRQRGFHPTGTCGVFGATAGAAVVSQLSASELTNAFGINVSQASGSRQYTEKSAWTKRIHPGLAARDSMLATALATNGFHGSTEPFAGKMGFLRNYADDPTPDRLVHNLGTDYRIDEVGFKPYACCRYLHSSIDCALEIVRSNRIDPTEIRDVRVTGVRRVRELSEPQKRKTRPQTVVDAQFSPQYAVAVALVTGEAMVDQFVEERLRDPVLLSVMDRITIVENDSMTERHPPEWPARVEVKTPAKTYTAERSIPSGDPVDPPTWDELETKFRALTSDLSDDSQDAIIDAVRSVDETGVGPLCDVLRSSQVESN